MSVWSAMIGGLAGTFILTTVLRASSELRLTRVDLPFLLGTVVTANRSSASRTIRAPSSSAIAACASYSSASTGSPSL